MQTRKRIFGVFFVLRMYPHLLKGAKDVGIPVNTEKVLELAPDLIVVMYDRRYCGGERKGGAIYRCVR